MSPLYCAATASAAPWLPQPVTNIHEMKTYRMPRPMTDVYIAMPAMRLGSLDSSA